MEKLSSVSDIDIRRLSSVYDVRDTYLSAYVPVNTAEGRYDTGFIDYRVKAVKKALKSRNDISPNFEEAVKVLEKLTEKKPLPEERTMVVFLSPANGMEEVYHLAVEVEPMLVLDTSPFIKPLALALDDWYDYTLVLLDSENARIYWVSSNIVEDEKKLSEDIMKHHKKGGQSQMRFQRLRRGAVDAFMKKVAEALREIVQKDRGKYWRGIIIAGPGNAKKDFVEVLPMDLRNHVIDLLDFDFSAAERELFKAADEVALEDEKARSYAAVERFKEALFKGGSAVYGIDQVMEAAREGRVDVLLVDRDTSIPGFICENCQLVTRTRPKDGKCRACGTPLSPVDMVEEAIEFAERSDSEVEFVKDNEFLQSIGGVAALLRY